LAANRIAYRSLTGYRDSVFLVWNREIMSPAIFDDEQNREKPPSMRNSSVHGRWFQNSPSALGLACLSDSFCDTMNHCPDHIKHALIAIYGVSGEQADGYHFCFRLVCDGCGSNVFRLFIGDKKSVKADCAGCSARFLVYDLALYPAATKEKGGETFGQVGASGQKPGSVYVQYEYGELDEDMEFDPNDITWCKVWFDNGNGLANVLDDETA